MERPASFSPPKLCSLQIVRIHVCRQRWCSLTDCFLQVFAQSCCQVLCSGNAEIAPARSELNIMYTLGKHTPKT